MELIKNNGSHLIAGGLAGTVGAVVTCPLEVVKTRLQSSVATFKPIYNLPALNVVAHSPTTVTTCTNFGTWAAQVTPNQLVPQRSAPVGLVFCLRYIVATEGVRGLFKGLGPNLVGVIPSRSIYFLTYEKAKSVLNEHLTPNTPAVHFLSALCGGITSSSATNPIWFVKTRLQLDQKREGNLTYRACIQRIYQMHGIRGFYKGLTASYYGVTETIIHFVIYEHVKARLLLNTPREKQGINILDYLKYMLAGAISKSSATCVAYPHEVVRTRLRQEGNKYKSFIQTLLLVFKEEGSAGLYRGLATQLVRQIPNTAITMATYELVSFLLKNQDT